MGGGMARVGVQGARVTRRGRRAVTLGEAQVAEVAMDVGVARTHFEDARIE